MTVTLTLPIKSPIALKVFHVLTSCSRQIRFLKWADLILYERFINLCSRVHWMPIEIYDFKIKKL